MTEKTKILLVCSSGMSTSLLVKAIQKETDKQNFPAEVSSAPVAGFEDIIKGADAILVGPQIRHRFERLKEIANREKKPIMIIPPQVYGMVDGKAALNIVKKMLAR